MRFSSPLGSNVPFLSEYACEDFIRILITEKEKTSFLELNRSLCERQYSCST